MCLVHIYRVVGSIPSYTDICRKMEDILTRHRKEFKALDGEKRAAIKKAKTTKGKKAKDEIQAYVLLFHGACLFL
jgi:NAD(P)H-hydrate repair Nnr-like enzyme with NAD(P)H-hydrate dehydratase domain